MLEIAPGLRRWTAFHDHWQEDVGSLAVETSDGLVLIDPIDPPGEVAAADHVLVTVYWHGRSTGSLGAKRVWSPARSDRPLKSRGIEVTDPFRAGDELPGRSRVQPPTRYACARNAGWERRRTTICVQHSALSSTSRSSACSSRTASRSSAVASKRLPAS